MEERKTAGELAQQALKDDTKYDPLELAYGVRKEVAEGFQESVKIYSSKIEENEFCAVMVLANDPLLVNLKRRKFYCWPWLPSPRPNQTVLLYNKALDKFTKRLWVLPDARAMAILANPDLNVQNHHKTMQMWSLAFYKGIFWEYIRAQHDIKMLSQEEYFKLHSKELAKAKIDNPELFVTDAINFSEL